MSLPIVDRGRCTGHCCRRFFLDIAPAEMSALVALDIACANRELQGEDVSLGYRNVPWEWEGRRLSRAVDIRQIADMVEYVGYEMPTKGSRKPGGHPPRMGHYYRCKNLLPSGDCGIYETRPEMCRSYPYGHECEQAECTWADAAKETEGCR